jgi:hypothetical protein
MKICQIAVGMLSQRTPTQIAVIGLFILLAAGCDQIESPVQILPREDKIPSGQEKVTPENDIYPPILHSLDYEQPIPVPGYANLAGAEDSPFVTPDGNTLYFTFNPDVNVMPDKQLIDGVTGLYTSQLVNGIWQEAERIILNDDLSLDGCETIQSDLMWFCSVRTGNFREVDLYTAYLIDGTWTNWQNAGERINSEIVMGEMHITPDRLEIYFDGAREGGKGTSDIWLTRLVDGIWQDPVNLSEVNTEVNEIRPFVTQDGTELWFTRQYQGSPAIFRSVNIDGVWAEPELIISQFAAEPSLDAQGNIYFAHHFFKDGQMLEADIYVARKIHD